MADAVAVRRCGESATHYVVHLTNISDGTGESAVVKVDKSTLVASDGAEPASLDIEKVAWACNGMEVKILWDHTTDDLALALSGSGVIDLTSQQGVVNCAIKDPRSAGDTGDILLTTSNHSSGDTYNITLWLRKSAS